MREKLLFIIKVIGYSLGLFILWHPISKVYGFFLDLGLSHYMLSEKFPYIKSLTLIPFISLVIATPKIRILKKAGIISIGVAIFLVIDIFAVKSGMENVQRNPTAFITYRIIKIFLPFLLWIITSYPYLGGFFNSRIKEASNSYYPCPICDAEHANIINHIREVHGEKSFKIKRVKKFISENPHLS